MPEIRNPCGNLKATRERLGLTQAQFYPHFGVCQSAGSRYEHNAREIPRYFRTLIEIALSPTGDKLVAQLRNLPMAGNGK